MLPVLDNDRVVPLLVHELSLYAPAQIDGREGLAFLDSAASEASLHPDWAQNLPRAAPITIRSAFEEHTFETVYVTLGFLGATLPPQRVLVRPVRKTSPPFEVPAVLNAATMFAEPMVLDFRVLAVYRPHAVSGIDWHEISAYRAKQGLWILELAAPGRPAWALFDTGAGLSAFNAAHLDELGLDLRPEYRMSVTDAIGATTHQEIIACRGLAVAGKPLPGDGFVVDLSNIEEALDHRVDLVLGVSALLHSGLRWRFEPATGQVFGA